MQELFWVLALVTLVGVPLYSGRARGRRYAVFGLVVLAFSLPGAVAMHGRLASWADPTLRPWLDLAFAYSMAASGGHLVSLVRARLRHGVFRLFVSIPGQAFLAMGALSGVWLLALFPIRAALWGLGAEGPLEVLRWLDPIPPIVALISIFTSLRPVRELVRVQLSHDGPDEVSRVPVERYRRLRRPAALERRPLRVVQITDPHLGPWQPIAKLRRHVAELMRHDPDLVLLTGDFMTMESSGTPGALAEALEPLAAVGDRCYAVFGNHDHDSGDEVRSALKQHGVRLLVDEEAVAATPVGPVQIIGADYVGGERRQEHIEQLLRAFPRRDDHLRLLLLHDPLGFQFVPKGAADLTLSGHTHGGQLGLVSFGLDWTVLTRSRWPDHGLFGHGPNRLYVHRGTGFYGFPLRVGVPGEASLLELVLP